MSRRVPRPVLTDAVASFQAEIARLAWGAAAAVIKAELARREAIPIARPPGRPKVARRRAPGAMTSPPRQASEAPVVSQVAEPREPDVVPSEPAAAPPAGTASSTTTADGKRTKWTREAVIELLANAIASGEPTDAAFMTRHGPPGAVAAIRRIFGRFEAAMNVAALHVSKLYPEGLPQQRSTRRASR